MLIGAPTRDETVSRLGGLSGTVGIMAAGAAATGETDETIGAETVTVTGAFWHPSLSAVVR